MKGVVTQHMKDPSPSVVDDLEKPEPNATQLLVKSIYAAINPVYVQQDTFSPGKLMVSLEMRTWPKVVLWWKGGL